MSQYSSQQDNHRDQQQNQAVSPELREVMHMLNALEQNAGQRRSGSGR